MLHLLLSRFIILGCLITLTSASAQITLTKNYTGGTASAYVISGDSEADYTNSLIANTLLGETKNILVETGVITRTNNNGDTTGTSSSTASIDLNSSVDLATNTFSYLATIIVANTRTGSTIGGSGRTSNILGATDFHRLEFTIAVDTDFTMEGALTVSSNTTFTGSRYIRLRRLTPSTQTYYFAYNGDPSPGLSSGTLTPGTYELIITNMNDASSNNEIYTHTASYTLDFPDVTAPPGEPTTTISQESKPVSILDISVENDSASLTFDMGTHSLITIYRSYDLSTWTPITTTHNLPYFSETIAEPRTFYRISATPTSP